MAPTALAVSRMNRRRETAALSAGWPSSNGEEIVWLADLRAKRDAARPDGDWGFMMKSNHPGSGVVVKLRMEENPRASVPLFALWACAGFAQEATLKLTHTVPLNGVQGRFDHFTIDTQGKRLAEIDLPAVLAALGTALTLVMPVNHESDSVDQIQRLADQFGNPKSRARGLRST